MAQLVLGLWVVTAFGGDRRPPIEHGIAGQVQHPHAPFPKEAFDFVPTDTRGDVIHGGY